MANKTHGFDEEPQVFQGADFLVSAPPVSVVIGEGGRLVIPADMRKRMGIGAGDTVALRLDGDSLKIVSSRMALEAVQRLARKLKKPGESEVDAFLAERREETKRVDERFDRLEREAEEISARKRKR